MLVDVISPSVLAPSTDFDCDASTVISATSAAIVAVESVADAVQSAVALIDGITSDGAAALIENGAIEAVLHSVEAVVQIIERAAANAQEANVTADDALSGNRLTASIEVFAVEIVSKSLGTTPSNTSDARSGYKNYGEFATVAWTTGTDRPSVGFIFDFSYLDCTVLGDRSRMLCSRILIDYCTYAVACS
jgi:hypothetical protein